MFCVALALSAVMSCLFVLYLRHSLSSFTVRQNTGNRVFQSEDEVVHLQQGNLIAGASKIGQKEGDKKIGQLQILGVGVK